jgi:TetR/AcrR family transcriptional regulator, repressor for neighboring sulfatase
MSETSDAAASRSGTPRPEGRHEVAQAAIRAAASLFAETNPSKVSVRQIAARAGVSHALVHRYLGSKEEILREVLALNREEADAYWAKKHSSGDVDCAFDASLPPVRYVRTAMRAVLDDVELRAEDVRLPHADRMLELARTKKLARRDTDAGFDVRILFSAATAMAAGMAVAEDFFLAQSGLEDAERKDVRAEVSRLIARVMTLSERPRKIA